MREIKVVWHKVPDTDCVLSAIIACDFLEKKWYKKATPFIQWELNKETSFVLQKLNIKIPEIKTSFPKNTNICLVDHNEEFQTLDNIWELNVEWIIDHHKINFESSNPLNIMIEPICSTASILYKMYKQNSFEISQEIWTMMLACIISDSLLFRSATTTKQDIEIAEDLKKIAWIKNLEDFAMPMFNAKSDLWDMPIEKLIKYDYKEFDLNWTKAWVGTLETTNPGYWIGRKQEILEWLQKIKNNDGLDFIMLSIVDIIGEKNTTVVLDWDDTKTLEEVFKCKVENNLADLKSRLSRKKQIVPDLTEFFK